jgi:hypothetical protein
MTSQAHQVLDLILTKLSAGGSALAFRVKELRF